MTAPFAAFCDADVLVPIVCCDFLLTAAEAGLVDVVVSETVLAEVERNLIENFPNVNPTGLRRRIEDMRIFLSDQIVEVGDLDAVAEVVNAKDRHVVAAAIEAEAGMLVTNDRRLRDEVERSSLPIRPMSADDLGALLYTSDRDAVGHVLDMLLAKRRRRPLTRSSSAASQAADQGRRQKRRSAAPEAVGWPVFAALDRCAPATIGVVLTDRLEVRLPQEGDRSRFVELFCDDDFMVFSAEVLDAPAANQRFDEMLVRSAEVSFAKQPVIERATGTIVGYAGVNSFPFEGETRLEFGWRLAPDARGLGYATEATKAVLELARSIYEGEILGMIDPRNLPSQNVARKVGFRF